MIEAGASFTKTSHDSETPAQGQQVITACALIHHNFSGTEKVFIAKRAPTKKFLPNVWELPGGHIDFGEDVIEGLKREIREEFGMDATIGDPFAVFTYLNPIKGSHSIEIIYFAAFSTPLDRIDLHPEDHSDYKWVDASELEAIRTHNLSAGDTENEIDDIRRGLTLLAGARPNFGK